MAIQPNQPIHEYMYMCSHIHKHSHRQKSPRCLSVCVYICLYTHRVLTLGVFVAALECSPASVGAPPCVPCLPNLPWMITGLSNSSQYPLIGPRNKPEQPPQGPLLSLLTKSPEHPSTFWSRSFFMWAYTSLLGLLCGLRMFLRTVQKPELGGF